MAAFETAVHVFNSAEDAAEYIRDGIINNNEINDACFNDWQDAGTAFDVYIDGNNADLAETVERDEVVALVQPWLDRKQAFEAALASGPAFVEWASTQDNLNESIDRIVKADSYLLAPEWSDRLGSDYIATLKSGEVVAWGMDLSDGREIVVFGKAETMEASEIVGSIKVRRTTEA